MPLAVTDVAEASFAREVLEAEMPVVVHFWSPQVVACHQLKPSFHELGAEYRGRVKFAAVNVEDSAGLVRLYDVTNLPCLILYRDGEETARNAGLIPAGGVDPKEQIREWLARSLRQ